MKPRVLVSLALAALLLAAPLAALAPAQQSPSDSNANRMFTREPEFVDSVDSAFGRASSPANRQKFFSIVIFLVLGGACTYAELRGIKKVIARE